MIPGSYDIEIYRGGTYQVKITARTPGGVTTDFTKYTEIRMQIRQPWVFTPGTPTPEPLFELTTGNGRISKADGNQAIVLRIEANETETLPFIEGQYDLELVVVAEGVPDEVDKFLRGKVTVIHEVTV